VLLMKLSQRNIDWSLVTLRNLPRLTELHKKVSAYILRRLRGYIEVSAGHTNEAAHALSCHGTPYRITIWGATRGAK
jgi:hypothetical protein